MAELNSLRDKFKKGVWLDNSCEMGWQFVALVWKRVDISIKNDILILYQEIILYFCNFILLSDTS
ncbi:hypothetical protein HMPREF1990_02042 [Porphyromonas gingivalis W4087]|nr:hypothetical protein HMPREF1990_02042 [Porphyromonas gingivalis W4087]PDP62846.1 hypothetical protein CLI83_03030 [Porphyromonas gingivalis]PDP73147.1 hypothetical protein CLI81_05470 [Porphyromonas gingivalis]PDP74315.1 hypothetical protein CLI79_10150 [Porphyromonas gingivalis]